MDKPNARTTITVKSVSTEAWNEARKAAAKQDETMGAWLSRAMEDRVKLEDGPRELPPDKLGGLNGKLAPVAIAELATLMQSVGQMAQGIAALGAVRGRGIPKREVKRCVELVDEHVRHLMGEPSRPVANINGRVLKPRASQTERKPDIDGQTIGQTLPVVEWKTGMNGASDG